MKAASRATGWGVPMTFLGVPPGAGLAYFLRLPRRSPAGGREPWDVPPTGTDHQERPVTVLDRTPWLSAPIAAVLLAAAPLAAAPLPTEAPSRLADALALAAEIRAAGAAALGVHDLAERG